MIMINTSSFSSSPHFHHHQQQHSVLQNQRNKNPKNYIINKNNHDQCFGIEENNNNVVLPGRRILKITWFMSSARNYNNNNDVVVDDHGEKQRKKKPCFLCQVCDKIFSSNKGLNVHMRCHAQRKKGTITSSSLELEPNEKDYQLPLSNYLPPINYKTNKRRKRYFIDDNTRNAAQALLDMSRGKFLKFDDDVNKVV
ncbi:hypothetical protein TSUD_393770 [Trifolium subterraneum]|uniref:C2H2-type domain-containing protein n=1 Tax=Trifolium subterraneum TaxID=3900 RepID=A0A2Z6MPB3_TRISU|nr:hypothetical protein TSUD_393770 [Trifolium subterraneum]